MLAALERYQYQQRSTMLFKPSIDRRYSEEKVVTHKGQEHTSVLVSSGSEILEKALPADVVAVDELFMIPGSAAALINLLHKGKTILASTLQLSSEPDGYKPFHEVRELMPWATSIEVCPTVCAHCDSDAYYTQRIGAQPKQILVGGAESYQPVCWRHSLVNRT
jgi:thymidine kinase